MQLSRVLVLVLLLVGLPLGAAQAEPDAADAAWCGTGPARMVINVAKHVRFQRRLARAETAFPTKASRVYRSGQIAVVEDAGEAVDRPNPFDLAHQGIQFVRRQGGYRPLPANRPLFAAIGERLELGNDDSVAVDLPDWEFPFYAETYSRVWVNADGHLSFGEPDSSFPVLDYFLEGPPRIAAFWRNLDPSQTSGEDGVFVRVFPERLRISWLRVPERRTENRNSFQITLHRDGRIQILYGDVATASAIVGISPGPNATLELLDLDIDRPPVLDGAIAERFSSLREVDDLEVLTTFYEHFQDVYDQVILWLDFPSALAGGIAFAYHSTLRNQVQGIGRGIYDYGNVAGSERLEGYLQMGTLERYPEDPDEVFLRHHSTMTVLSHELAHQWLAFARFLDQDGNVNSGLLGWGRVHWSFHHDTDASVMWGNDLRDHGDGTFLTIEATRRFSDLDLYLMGLISPEEVPDFYYVDHVDGPPAENVPRVGVSFSGDRVDVGIDQVIAALGPRIPSSAESPKSFRVAFVLLTADGRPPSPGSLPKLKRIRGRWLEFFSESTRGRGAVRAPIRLR